MSPPSSRWGAMSRDEKQCWLLAALGFARMRRLPDEWTREVPPAATEQAVADAAFANLELTPQGARIVDGLARVLGL